MSATSAIGAAFWDAVHACLMTFHAMSSGDASKALERLQDRLNRSPDPELIFHEEPFYVAADIVRSPVRLEGDYVEPYEKILSESRLPGLGEHSA